MDKEILFHFELELKGQLSLIFCFYPKMVIPLENIVSPTLQGGPITSLLDHFLEMIPLWPLPNFHLGSISKVHWRAPTFHQTVLSKS